jgi:hypothetical protein
MLATRSFGVLFPACALFCGASLVRAQDVHVVDSVGGPGSDFTGLDTALFAAQDGDILLVRDGVYGPLNQLVGLYGKSLTVIADAGHHPSIAFSLLLNDIAAGSTFTWRGIDIRPTATSSTQSGTYDLIISGFAGGVRFEDVLVQKASLLKAGGTQVAGCTDIAFARCALVAGTSNLNGQPGLHALNTASSQVALHDCELTGSSYTPTPPYTLGNSGGDGVRAVTSRLVVSGGAFAGAPGLSGSISGTACGNGGSGGSAIRIVNSLGLVRALDVQLTPALGGGALAPCSAGADGVAVAADPGHYVALAGSARSLEVSATVREGQALQAHCGGEAGDLVLLLVGAQTTYVESPLANGVLLVAPLAVYALGALPGAAQASFPILELGAGIEGVVGRCQALFVSSSGALYLSNESDTVLLDAAF